MPERKWQPNFIENGILNPKNSKDESFGDLKLFKNQNLGNYLQTGLGIYFFEIKGKEFWRMARGSEGGHAKLAIKSMHKWKEVRNDNHGD